MENNYISEQREKFAKEQLRKVIDILYSDEDINIRLRDAGRIVDEYYDEYNDTYGLQMAKAELSMKGKEYSQALDIYSEAITRTDDQSLLSLFHARIGECYFNLYNYEAAVQHYDRAIAIASDTDDMFSKYVERAVACAALHNIDTAEAWLKAQYTDASNRTAEHCKLAVAKMYTEYVIHKFDIEKQSNADDNYRKNAAMYAQWRDLTSKAKVICAELDLDSEDNHFADMESVISLAASVDEYVDSVEDRTYAGEIVDIIDAINADKLDEAEELLNAQIAQGYAQSDTYCYLGKIAMLRGNLSEAEEKLLYSLEIKKDDIWTIGQLIQLYRRLDNDNEALKYSMLGSELGSHFCIEVAMQLLKKLKGTNEAIKHGEKYIDAVRQSRECIGVLSTQYGEKLIALDLLKAENRQLAEELISKITELNAYYKMVDFTVYTDDDAAKIRSACDEMVEANLLVVKNVQEECIEREKRSIVWRLVLVGIIWIAIGVLLILLGAYIGILAVLIGGLIIASSYAKNAHVYAAEEKGKKYGAFRAIINLLFRGKK